MVSAGVCFQGNTPLHFVEEKANVNAGYYVNDCYRSRWTIVMICCVTTSWNEGDSGKARRTLQVKGKGVTFV